MPGCRNFKRPFAGPFAGVRVGRVNGEFVVNPTFAQREISELDLMVAASRDAIVMVKGEAKEVAEGASLHARKGMSTSSGTHPGKRASKMLPKRVVDRLGGAWHSSYVMKRMAHAITIAVGLCACSDGGDTSRVRSDAGTTSCACTLADGGLPQAGLSFTAWETSWECYCSAFDCSQVLDAYSLDPPGALSIQEYAACNLVVVETQSGYDPHEVHVFDSTSRELVGETRTRDYGFTCPFDNGQIWGLRAGVFPPSDCLVTSCRGRSC